MNGPNIPEFQNNLVYIHNVDSYNGKYLAACISKLEYQSAVVLPGLEDYGEDGPPPEQDTKESPVEGSQLALHSLPPESNDTTRRHYEVIGPVADRSVKIVSGVKTIIPTDDYLKSALKCGTLILDISQVFNVLEKVRTILQEIDDSLTKNSERSDAITGEAFVSTTLLRRIILISTPLTWAETKHEDPEAEDQLINEDMYNQRIPHSAYKAHYYVEEKLIDLGNKFKDQLQVAIVTSGFTYGCEESLFFLFFQLAWESERIIPIFGNGQNNLPVIHVKDLSSIISSFLQSFPQEKKVIFAMENDVVKLQDIILLIGNNYGSGYFQYLPKEEVILTLNVAPHVYFQLTSNIGMQTNSIQNDSQEEGGEYKSKWMYTANFLGDMDHIFEEFKDYYNLKPHKLLLFGPPASGKTKLALHLSSYYGNTLYSDEILSALIIEELEWKLHFIRNLKPEDSDISDEMISKGKCFYSSKNEVSADDIKKKLENIQKSSEFPREILIKYLKEKIISNESKNKGWIFEGFPKLYEDCIDIFGEITEEYNEEMEGEDSNDDEMRSKYPDQVISLEAPDLFLCERVMLQREKTILHLPYNERDMLKNLKEFKRNLNAENNLLTYFEDAKVEILRMDIAVKDMTMEKIFDIIVKEVGEPSTKYAQEGLETSSEIELRKQNAEEENLKGIKTSIMKENEEKIKQWTSLYKILKQEEAEKIRINSEALRQYLMRNVFPLLTKGLAVVAKLRPADPIDFLAEYLFRENASGKIFDPGHNFCADFIMIIFDEIAKYVSRETLSK